MRIFLALDIDDVIRQRIHLFMDGVRGFAPDVRWVRVESLHVTLKFIGERPAEFVEEVKRVVSSIQADPVEMTFSGFGFFPGAKAPRVFWVGIEAGPQLGRLAQAVDEATSGIGVAKEDHPFSPHLTLARGGGGSGAPRQHKSDAPNQRFACLQEKLSALSLPEFGTMTAREFFLYQSQLGRGGSRYTKIARFALT